MTGAASLRTSPTAVAPAGATASLLEGRRCAWCEASLEGLAPSAKYCRRKCRQAAWRLRKRRELGGTAGLEPARFAYADPPYPGLSKKYYGHHPDYAGEVDHAALIARLEAGGYAGWALSTSSRALQEILPLCPPGVRVCAWVKPIGVARSTYGLHSAWEALIVAGGRKRQPGVRDWLRAQPARKWGTLMGRKPVAFCAWLFDCLGMLPGDELDDLFPGTGAVARAWREVSAREDPMSEQERRDRFEAWAASSGASRCPTGRGSLRRRLARPRGGVMGRFVLSEGSELRQEDGDE